MPQTRSLQILTCLCLLGLLLPACSLAQAPCETAGGPFMGFNYGGAGRGIKFACTSSVIVDYWGQDTLLYSNTDVELTVYESTNSGSVWTRIDTEVLPNQPAGAVFFYTSAGRNIPLVSGRWYAFVTYICGSGNYNADYGTPYPLSFANVGTPAGGIPADVVASGCTSQATTTLGPNVMEVVMTTEICLAGPTCSITSPAPAAAVSGTVPVTYDIDHPNSQPLDCTFEYSLNGGGTWFTATPAGGGANPVVGQTTPQVGLTWDWDTFADNIGTGAPATVDLRITVDDGSVTGECTVAGLLIDNQAPSPTCTLTLVNPSPVYNFVTFDFVGDSVNAGTIDVSFEYSDNGGVSYQPATPAPPGVNPLQGWAVQTPTQFVWDSRSDNVAMGALVPGVLFRAVVTDGVAPNPGNCATAPFDVDNTALCFTLCGDCNQDTFGPDITDALVAAQIGALLILPTPAQIGCCDVNSSTTVDILDALVMAQFSAQLPVTLTCP